MKNDKEDLVQHVVSNINGNFTEANMESIQNRKQSYKCPICDHRCSQEGNLRKHIETVHEGKKPHKCSICDYSTSKKGYLSQPIKSVHE